MFGTFIGDVVGSPYEKKPIKMMNFPLFSKDSRFTDDTVMTAATAYAILTQTSYAVAYKKFGRAYPERGYGRSFKEWLVSDSMEPYNSWGNGSAMRVSPIGYAFNSIKAVLREAKESACATHNHPEGIKGAQAVALAIYFARKGKNKIYIKKEISKRFGYNLQRKVNTIRKTYQFDVSCQGSVPEAIICFLESKNFEEAIRLSISLGGDSDTQAAIAGSIAEAYYHKAPVFMVTKTASIVPKHFTKICNNFYDKFVRL